MKAKTLIKKLQKLNPEMEVYVPMIDAEYPVYRKSIIVAMEELSDLNNVDSESVVIVIQ